VFTAWYGLDLYVFCVDLRTNSHYFPIQHELSGLYNRDGLCLLRGTDWVLKCNSGLSSDVADRSRCCVHLPTGHSALQTDTITMTPCVCVSAVSLRYSVP
jgi:hypothetical protein